MHRHPQSQQQQHYSRDLSHPPGTPQKSRRTAGTGRKFFSLSSSGRTPRLHPIFLIPVFLCGTFLAPWFSTHLGIGFSHDASADGQGRSSSSSSLREPVYRPPEQDWSPQQAIAPADAPPLKREDDYAGAFEANAAKRRRRDDSKNRRGNGRPATGGDSDDGIDDELWEASLDGGDSTSSSSPFLIHGGLLYFRTSSTLIPPHNLERPFPIAQVRRGAAPAQPHVLLSDSEESAMTGPPPTPKDWLVPGELFAHAPGKRKHVAAAVAPAAAGGGGPAGAKKARGPAAVPLRAPIPPAPARQPPPVAQQRASGPERRQEPMRDARGHVLGPNAAAMARAKKENRPFVPGTPAELLQAVQKARLRKVVERESNRKEEAAAAERKKEAEERRRKESEQKRLGMQPGVGLRRVEADGHAAPIPNEDEDLRLNLGEDDDGSDDDDEDDEALLAAVRALSPAELADLTPDERALVAELESANKIDRKPAGVAPRAAGRKTYHEIAAEAEAARLKQLAAENKPHGPEKPVFKGMKGMEEDRKRQMAALAAQRMPQKRDIAAMAAKDGPGEPKVQHQAAAPRRRVKRSMPEPEVAAPEPVVPPLEVKVEAEEVDVSTAKPAAADAASANDHTLARRASIPAQPKAERLHPITYLIAEAETKWEDLLRGQSQSLEEAVREYKRRYKMNPPAGFDSWWRYAMQNRVVLVDEYDQIYDDILPFLSLPPGEFRKRVKALKSDTTLPWHDFTFSFQIKDGSTDFPPASSEYSSKTDLLDLLGEVAAMLPDLDLRINKGDEPMVVISGEARKRHEDLAKRQKVLPDKSLYETLEPTGFSAWDSLCPHNSTARRIAQGLTVDTPSSSALRSFIAHDTRKAQDLCEHPENRELNGFTAWSGPRPHLLYPIFSPVKTAVHGDLLLPYLTSDYYTEIGRDPLWEQKKYNQVLWRGETTGTYHAKGTGWRKTQRARLVQLANEISGETAFHIADTSASDSLRRMQAPSKDVLPLYFDVVYTGVPKQCSSKDSTCQLLQREYRFEREMLPAQENQYKYVLDVDANYASGNFKRLMSSRSLVFKSSIFPEWWSRRIMPWYHYIPIKSDYSDLVDAAAYFIGAPDGAGSHDRDAKRIAQQGKKWSEEHWREADIAAYMFRLLLEYARLLNRDEKDLHSMDFL